MHKYDNYECVYTAGSKCQVINSVSTVVFVAWVKIYKNKQDAFIEACCGNKAKHAMEILMK